jgi:hypothetical protein
MESLLPFFMVVEKEANALAELKYRPCLGRPASCSESIRASLRVGHQLASEPLGAGRGRKAAMAHFFCSRSATNFSWRRRTSSRTVVLACGFAALVLSEFSGHKSVIDSWQNHAERGLPTVGARRCSMCGNWPRHAGAAVKTSKGSVAGCL